MRRRALLAANGGGGELEFPITLVEGDNGQVGIDVFNYLYGKIDNDYYAITEEKNFILKEHLILHSMVEL